MDRCESEQGIIQWLALRPFDSDRLAVNAEVGFGIIQINLISNEDLNRGRIWALSLKRQIGGWND